jgi:hypothetical protein
MLTNPVETLTGNPYWILKQASHAAEGEMKESRSRAADAESMVRALLKC